MGPCKTPPLPCVAPASAANTPPLPCVAAAFATKIRPLPCTVFPRPSLAKSRPLPRVSLPSWAKTVHVAAVLRSDQRKSGPRWRSPGFSIRSARLPATTLPQPECLAWADSEGGGWSQDDDSNEKAARAAIEALLADAIEVEPEATQVRPSALRISPPALSWRAACTSSTKQPTSVLCERCNTAVPCPSFSLCLREPVLQHRELMGAADARGLGRSSRR